MTGEMTIGIGEIDHIHQDFFALLDALRASKGDAFVEAFDTLIKHTEAHFAMEEELMRSYRFYAMQEHLDEHSNLLAEMQYFYDKAKKAPAFGRAYVDDYALDKFRRHIANLDSQLAMFLKTEWKAQEEADA